MNGVSLSDQYEQITDLFDHYSGLCKEWYQMQLHSMYVVSSAYYIVL